MAPHSSSSALVYPISCQEKHDVFVSFRGPDTRNNFVCHLDKALRRHGIVSFIDYRLERGQEIEPAILKAIKLSNISVIILSKDFASSSFCLDEVVRILECKVDNGQIVLPVFYHVDPTDVQSQTASFGASFAKHEENLMENFDKVGKWRNALSRAAMIAGIVWTDSSGPDSELIDKIIDDILRNLRNPISLDVKDLDGMESQAQQIESLLNVELDDVRAVGIWGMGGIGKTTIAKIIFRRLSSRFEVTCFVKTIREECKRHGRSHLDDESIVKVLNEGNVNPRSGFSRRQLQHSKALVVLDDVDGYQQIENLVNWDDWFGAGSRILITSRDRSVFQGRVHEYRVKELHDHDALKLFSFFAFKQNHPKPDTMHLSERVVRYANGNSLALKVLGSFLHGKSEEEWRSALDRLERMPNMEIHDLLKISYDGLDYREKQVFLHIACFFKGDCRFHVEEVLHACGFFPIIDLRVLQDKALIDIKNNIVEVHNLLQEMGWEIVRHECMNEPGKRSRLWDREDICNVLRKSTGTENVIGLCVPLDSWDLTDNLHIAPTAFVNMNRVQILQVKCDHPLFDSPYFEGLESCYPKVLCHQGLESLPGELRYVKWHFCSLESLPSNFNAEKLVELDMSRSNLIRLWNGVQNFTELKVIRLRYCKRLIEMPDFSRAAKLKTVDFEGCEQLLTVSPSICHLNNLETLNLRYCQKIKFVPSTKHVTSLKILDLEACLMLDKFPELPNNIEKLYLSDTAISEIPPFVRSLTRLRELSLRRCMRLDNLPSEIFQLQSLDWLDISGPYVNLLDIENLHFLCSLCYLALSGDNISSIPESINLLSHLQVLDLSECTSLQSLPNLPPLQRFFATNCKLLKTVPDAMIVSLEGYSKRLADPHMEQFLFINCQSLDQIAYRKILMQARERISLLACKNLDRRREFFHCALDSFRTEFLIAFPDDEVPKWITHHCIGSCVNVSLPPNWCRNFLGFALCIVLEFEDEDTELIGDLIWIRWECRYKSSRGESFYASTLFDLGACIGIQLEGKHVFLYYVSNFHLRVNENKGSNCLYDEVSFKVHIEDGKYGISNALKVIKSGVELLYDDGKLECRGAIRFMEKEKELQTEKMNLELGLNYPESYDNGRRESIMIKKRKLNGEFCYSDNLVSSSSWEDNFQSDSYSTVDEGEKEDWDNVLSCGQLITSFSKLSSEEVEKEPQDSESCYQLLKFL